MVLCVSLGGCSSVLSKDETKDGKTNDQNAKSNAQQQTTAIASAMDGNGQAAADGLYTGGSGSQGTITSKSLGGGELQVQGLEPLDAPPAAAGCTCTGGSCTFKDCDRGGKNVLNGTLTTADGKFTCDLTWKLDATANGQGSVTSIHVVADMTTTPTAIKGTLHTDGSVAIKGISEINVPGAPAGAGNTSWTNDAKWDVVVANKAPSGGSVTYDGTYKVGDTTYTGKGSVSFP
jgi:hypothetical protein